MREAGARSARDPAAWFPFDSPGGCLLQTQNQKQAVVASASGSPGWQPWAAPFHLLSRGRCQGSPSAIFLGTSQSRRWAERGSGPRGRRENNVRSGHQGLRPRTGRVWVGLQEAGVRSAGPPRSMELQQGVPPAQGLGGSQGETCRGPVRKSNDFKRN